jgi:hypothetical protein
MRIASFDIGEKNFAYCVGVADVAKEEIEIVKVALHDVLEKKRQTIAESCARISRILLNDPLLSVCDVVLIEQQMRANVRAQRVSQHVWSFFHTLFPDLKIVYVPSHLKTQRFLGKNTLGNKQRKLWSVDQIIGCTPVLSGHDSIKQAIREMGKKDDVCDTILQLLAYANVC